MNYFSTPKDNNLKNCSRHTFKKLGMIYTSLKNQSTMMVMECVYCGKIEYRDEQGR